MTQEKTIESTGPTRSQVILDRWLEIGGLSVAGAAIVALAGQWMIPFIRSRLLEPGYGIPFAALLILICSYYGHGRLAAWLGLKNLSAYPPPWIAGFFGTLPLILCWRLFPDAFPDVTAHTVRWYLPALLAIVILIAHGLVSGIRRLFERGARKETTPQQQPDQIRQRKLLTKDFDELRAWLRNDDEIEDPEMDAFGHDDVARRIAGRLSAGGDDHSTAPTIALVGELGSGKTSIQKLVRRQLKDQGFLDQSIIVVPISLWPFETPDAAVRGILTGLTEGLSHHVNTACLSAVPTRYVKAIESAGGLWSFLGVLLHSSASPDELLTRFQDIAIAIDMKIVLWIEDLERFAGVENLPGAEGGSRENERLAPIRSLLHLLDRKDRISVVLAANTLDARFDMEKIARFVERPPRLGSEEAGNLMEFFRRGCLAMLGDLVDPAGENRRVHLSNFGRDFEDFASDLTGEPKFLEYLVILCHTPRQLKHVLRAALDVWEPLVGEIDIDDVFLISILRITEPDVFALVEKHIDLLRKGPTRLAGTDPKPSPFDEGMTRLMEDRPRERWTAVDRILDFVFPNRKTGVESHSVPQKPQGLTVNNHVDYWSRFLIVPDLADDARDQPLLKEIELWEHDRTGKLPEHVADPGHSEGVFNFGAGFSAGALNDLLRTVINGRAGESPDEWPIDHRGEPSPPGIVEIWRIMNRCAPNQSDLKDLLKDAIRSYSRRNLTLIDELMDRFATVEPRSPAHLDRAAINELRKPLEDALSAMSETEIIESLRGAGSAVLLHCVWSLDRIRSGNLNGHPFQDWPPFADRLLDASKHEPPVVLPQLLPFVVSDSHPTNNRQPTFDEEKARELFDFDRLIDVLRRGRLDASNVPEEIAKKYRVVITAIEGFPGG
jgi:hypothetical protein